MELWLEFLLIVAGIACLIPFVVFSYYLILSITNIGLIMNFKRDLKSQLGASRFEKYTRSRRLSFIWLAITIATWVIIFTLLFVILQNYSSVPKNETLRDTRAGNKHIYSKTK